MTRFRTVSKLELQDPVELQRVIHICFGITESYSCIHKNMFVITQSFSNFFIKTNIWNYRELFKLL